jgi:mRNA-degrading endonuclease RelE of RelBE toxin-antitoxin system
MYEIVILPHFKKSLKPLLKKYPSFKEVVISVLKDFKMQDAIYLGSDLYKIRFRTKEIARGKSRSFRLIILLVQEKNYLVPIITYFKGERDSISTKEISEHVKIVISELARS